MHKLVENDIELFTIELLQHLGYQYIYSPDIAPDGEKPERKTFEDVLLIERLQEAVGRINPNVPTEAREEAVKQIQRLNSPELIANNEAFHRRLTEGINVTYQKEGNSRGDLVWLIDFNNPDNNDFIVANQFTIVENNINKRLDVILFVNGIPLVVIELKNAVDENATIRTAFKQIQTYKQAIPGLFTYNGFVVISDGLEAKAGTISADYSRFMSWKSVDGKKEASHLVSELETLINGMLNKKTLLDLIRHFIVFEKTKREDLKTNLTVIETTKKLAAYHQYYAVNKAVESTMKAVGFHPSLGPSQREESFDMKKTNYKGGYLFTGMIEQVKKLRKNQTKAEEIFWELVRNKNFFGLKFRRQHQIGNYIVDFYCHSENLIIEFDGEVHNNVKQKRKDEIRDKYLTSLGNRVLRFRNKELLINPEIVLDKIKQNLKPPSSIGGRAEDGGYGSRKAGRSLAYSRER